MKIILALVLTVVIASCAVMSKDECLNADWFAIGEKDGSMGKDISLFEPYTKSCEKAGVTPNLDQYTSGRDSGLSNKFCTKPSAYGLGANGTQYNGVCKSFNEEDFLKAYKLGGALFDKSYWAKKAQSNLDKINANIKTMNDQIDELEREINDNPELTNQQIEQKRNIIHTNRANISSQLAARLTYQEELEEAQKNYSSLRDVHASKGYCAQANCFSHKF